MKKLTLVVCFCFNITAFTCAVCEKTLDSLLVVWENDQQADSTRTKAISSYVKKGFLYSNHDSALILSEDLLYFGKTHGYKNAFALAYNLMGSANQMQGNYSSAVNNYIMSLEVFEALGDKVGYAVATGSLAGDYSSKATFVLLKIASISRTRDPNFFLKTIARPERREKEKWRCGSFQQIKLILRNHENYQPRSNKPNAQQIRYF